MAENHELQNFIEYDLLPAMFERIDVVFPELEFRRKGDKWESKYHLDGEKDGGNKVVSYVYGNTKFMAVDHAREKVGLINLYMRLNGKEFIPAVKELAEVCGLSLPSSDSKQWREYEERQANREKADAAFVAALWEDSEQAGKVRDYLHSRYWTDELIAKAGLGLITPAIRDSLRDSQDYKVGGIGTTHILAIPYRNGSRLFGFKFREVTPQPTTKTKYLNSKGLSKSQGFLGIGVGVKDIVIVEGDLDALHAQAMGANNVVATAGNGVSVAQINDAIRRGAERFTLLFDNDRSGRGFVIPAIEEIQKTGKSIWVASFPDGVKDLDEYLGRHSIEEFQREIVDAAEPYHLYLLQRIIEKFAEAEKKNGEFTRKDREDFFNEVASILNSRHIKPYEREDIFARLERAQADLSFNMDDFREWANQDYLRMQETKRTEAITAAVTKIQEAVAAGRNDEAIELMQATATEQRARERAVEYAQVFRPIPPGGYATFLSEIKEGIPTGFIFEQGQLRERLTLNAGLTFICGYRGHGKTSFLNNIALNEAKRNVALGNGKSVLYFSYEVDKRRLIIDLLNTFVNDAEMSLNPSNTIHSYFKGHGDKWFRRGGTHYENFRAKKDEFFRGLLGSGALVVVDENYRVERLLDAIKYYISTREVSIVCIDYAQLIYSEDYSRQRTEEIKKVVNDIKDFANKQGIPFVLAAQFNREVDSPASVDTKNIGEGGDFERIADTCIGLFNLKELHSLPKNKYEEDTARALLNGLGLSLPNGESLKPIQGKLFVRLMKRRYGYYPLDTILEWEGRTKYITPNDPDALSPQAEQGGLFDEVPPSCF